MINIILGGLLIPLLGTSLGAACVLCMKKELHPCVQNALMGFAAGVMVAASVWSLLLPAIEQSADKGAFAFLPAGIGFGAGIIFLTWADRVTERSHSADGKVAMLVLAVVLHNIPEGMAVGAVYAGLAAGQREITISSALMLSVGIAVQNFPEGAIISMPLAAQGMKKECAFFRGVLSGVVEPIAGALTILLSAWMVPILPYLLSFAAGAMVYVVLRELSPELNRTVGMLTFLMGFVLMMALDVALG